MIEPQPALLGQFVVHAPLEHPSYAGHFPGYPIVPGVVCLDWLVTQYALAVDQPQQLHAISSVKFLAPVFPGDVLTVLYEMKPKTSENANANTVMTALTFTSFKPSPLSADPQKTCVVQMLLQSAPRLA